MFLYKTSLPNGRIRICNWVVEGATNFVDRCYPLIVAASYMKVQQLHGMDTY
jgi:hypothetical protein